VTFVDSILRPILTLVSVHLLPLTSKAFASLLSPPPPPFSGAFFSWGWSGLSIFFSRSAPPVRFCPPSLPSAFSLSPTGPKRFLGVRSKVSPSDLARFSLRLGHSSSSSLLFHFSSVLTFWVMLSLPWGNIRLRSFSQGCSPVDVFWFPPTILVHLFLFPLPAGIVPTLPGFFFDSVCRTSAVASFTTYLFSYRLYPPHLFCLKSLFRDTAMEADGGRVLFFFLVFVLSQPCFCLC